MRRDEFTLRFHIFIIYISHGFQPGSFMVVLVFNPIKEAAMEQKSGRITKEPYVLDLIIWGSIFIGLIALGFMHCTWFLKFFLSSLSFPV